MVQTVEMVQPCISTRRLHLRPFRLEDCTDLLALAQAEPVFRYLRQPYVALGETSVREQIYAYNDVALLHPGYGTWRVSEQHGDFVGMVFLEPVAGCSFAHFGGGGLPRFWGRGYALEAAATMFEYSFQYLGLPSVAAYVHIANKAAAGCAQMCGMEKFLDFNYFDAPSTAYVLHQAVWQQRRTVLAQADHATNLRKLLRLLQPASA